MQIGIGLSVTGQRAVAPNSGATLALDFQRSNYRDATHTVGDPSLLSGWSFTRASTGYALNSAGALVSFGSGVPRITDLGLLIEASRTNLVLQSQALDSGLGWSFTNISVSADQIAAPDGTTTADLVVSTSATGTHRDTQGTSITVTNSVAYTASFYAKAGTSTHVGLDFKNSDATQGRASFTLTGAGTAAVVLGASATATITALANGWYRCALTATVSSTSQAPAVSVLDASGNYTYTGNGESVYVWGVQFELGSTVSSYIPTTTVAVTRAADAVTLAYSPDGSAATVNYATSSTASPSPTSPINLGSSSGGAWVGNYVRSLVVTP